MSHHSFVHSISLKRNSFVVIKNRILPWYFYCFKIFYAAYLLTPIYSRSWHEFAQKMLKIFDAL
ncbi:hypothetical protein C9426_06925 [Serratia sp. S1B]|nr:hypothetical protein C9426_06925 [Serratia sp. S1B]